jgi:sugar transferase (PEP-CTERM/EpsH1 system associated)
VADPDGRNRKRNVIRKCISPMVDRFVAVSDDLKRWLTDTVGIAGQKVERIHNGVDTELFSPAGRQDARGLLGFDEQTVVIGTVGRLDPVKDHSSLLRAFLSVMWSVMPVRLVIVGDGPMRNSIEMQARQLDIADRILLLGERQDVAQIMKAFDVFALTSIAEGISNTILEAMATGLPIVATRVGGNPELVEHGLNGQLVSAGDVGGMAAAFQSYLDNSQLRREHGRHARSRAESAFSLHRMASDYAELYTTVMHKSSRRAA